MATIAAPSMKLQIVIDKKKNRVMFAEDKKEFVDFIFHILSLPLGAVQRILNKTSASLGSIGTLYDGLKNLDKCYILEDPGKDYLLDHLKAPYSGRKTSLLLPEASCSDTRKFYKCSQYLTVLVDMHCSHPYNSSCLTQVKLEGIKCAIAAVRGNENGYVKESTTFMVLDDLVVRPAEPTSLISLMNEHSINDVREIEKREVTFGTAEAIKLLKASLSSKTVLTDVFLRGAVKAEN